ncbi:MAG: hypothetical protein IJG40_08905 [Oscillospiraceae bacterium]|nr:hypothetical protein [Oscillospiraceae bacterium]
MKKTVKFFSFVLLVTMLFSLMASSASAIVSDDTAGVNGSIVFGGSGNGSINPGGSLVIGGDERPADDSPFTGIRVDESSKKEYDQRISMARAANLTSAEQYAQEAVAKYMKQADGDYSGIVDSDNALIQVNQDFLMYIRDHLDSVDVATLQTAVDLFGDDVVYGTKAEVDEEAVENRKEEIQERQEEIIPTIESLSAQLDAIEQRYREELGEETDAFLDDAEYVELTNQFNALADESSNLDTEDEVLDQVLDGTVALMARPASEDQIKSKFSQVCPGHSSLAEAVAGSNYNTVLTFNGNSFDICNSTDYRITVDLHAAMIDARQSPAAFTIRQGTRGGTVTFTNGTIVGDGFYVTSGGVLNLGGLVNGNYVDITVFAQRDAVYVENFGTAVIGQGTTLVGGIPGDDPTSWVYKIDATKYMRCSTEPVVWIANGGTVRMTGGTIEACSIDGTNPSNNNYAIRVDDGGILEISSSVAEVRSRNINSPAIWGRDGSTIDIHNGYIYGPEGIAVEGPNTRLSINGGKITGYGSYNTTSPYHYSGAAVEVYGDTTTLAGSDSPTVNITGGTLRSERSAGVVNIESATGARIPAANKNLIKRIAVDDVNVTIQEINDSDYARSRYLVTGKLAATDNDPVTYGYATLDEAINAANGLWGAVTIQLIEPKGETITVPTTVLAPANATSVTIDGSGYGIKTLDISAPAIEIDASGITGPVTIKNISISHSGDHAGNDGIVVDDGTVHIGPSVTVEHFANGLHVYGGSVTVNGMNIESHNDVGILTDGGETLVHFVKNDSSTPVFNPDPTIASLEIDGGWFAYKEAVDDPSNTLKKVATFVNPDISYVKLVEKDNYYEVLYNDTPNVEIDTTITKRYGTETLKDGTKVPYIVYDKSNPDPLVFKEVAPALVQIDAVGIYTDDNGKVVENGKVYPIFTAEKGKTGTIRIPDRAVLEDLPSGRYDLRFTFYDKITGYVMQDKLRLYVFPKYAGLFAVPNGLVDSDPTSRIISPNNADVTVTAGADPSTYVIDRELFNGEIVKYLNDTFDLVKNKTAYPIGAINWNVAVVTSELPDKVTIGNAADNTNSILLENYIYDGGTGYVGMTGPAAGDRTTWGVVPSGPYAGYYFYIISYADLNNLSAGQNWVFLNWNGFDGALKNLPLTIKNDYVTISPTKVDWSKIDNYVNFTVNPAPQTVYVDGELVPSGYWTYDASTKTLSIKGTYFAPLDSKDHTLEVVTGLGKASATVTTGMGLKANGIDYHVYGGNRVVNFQASDRINQDAGIWIGSSNPTKLDPSAYTWNGTNGFTLNPAFLNRLALGTYYISAYVYNGNNGYNYTTTTFRVISATQASNNPATGDNSNITLWLVILALSATALVVIIVPQFKKSKSMH